MTVTIAQTLTCEEGKVSLLLLAERLSGRGHLGMASWGELCDGEAGLFSQSIF